MDKEKRNYKEQLMLYALFAVIVLIGIFAFTGEYLDTKKENQELREAIIKLNDDWNSQYAPMVKGANEVYARLKECRQLNETP